MTARIWPLMLAAIGVCTVSSGCSDATPASVGVREETVDLKDCFAVDCESDRPTGTRIEFPAPEATRATACVPTEAPPVRIVWMRTLRDVKCAPLGFCSPNVTKFAPDGSFWTASATGIPLDSGSSERAGVFLAHYSSQNEVLAEKVIGTWTLPYVNYPRSGQFGDGAVIAIAPDDKSDHVWVSLSWWERDERSVLVRAPSWLAEYDSKAELIGGRRSVNLEPPSLVSIMPNPEGGVFYLVSAGASVGQYDAWGGQVSPRDGKAVLAKLNPELRLEWTQANPPDTSDELLGTDDGHAVLLETSESTATVSWWNERAVSEAELVLPPFHDVMNVVPDGVLLRERSTQASVTYREVSRTGQERWATRIPVAPALAAAGRENVPEFETNLLSSAETVAPDGSIVRIATFEVMPGAQPLTAIFRLDPSHETCNFSLIDEDGRNGSFYDTFVDQLSVDRDGGISFHATESFSAPDIHDQMFGRIE
jgi:hypothetical protein